MSAFIPHALPLSPPRRTRSFTSMSHRSERSLRALKTRSLITFRGLSDLGTAAILHEILSRLSLGPVAMSTAFGSDTQLLLGGLMGVWTAAAFAERLRSHTARLIKESAMLGKKWDAAFIYKPQIEQDEAGLAVMWMYLLDELEGAGSANMLRKLGAGVGRRGMVDALGELGVRNNVVNGALVACGEEGRVERKVEWRKDQTEKWRRVVEEQVEIMGSVALRGGRRVQREGKGKVDVPLFEGLKWAEVHGVCALAVLVGGYELVSLGGGGDLPGRFLGLGWMLAMGGLVAYPSSAGVLKRFRRTIENGQLGQVR